MTSRPTLHPVSPRHRSQTSARPQSPGGLAPVRILPPPDARDPHVTMSRATPSVVPRVSGSSVAASAAAPVSSVPHAAHAPHETLLATMMHRSAPRELLHKTSFRLATRVLESAVLFCGVVLGTALALLHAKHLRASGCAPVLDGAKEAMRFGIVELVVDDRSAVDVDGVREHGRSYLFSRERGVLLLSPQARHALNVSTVRVLLASDHACLGGKIAAGALAAGVGYQEVAANAFLTSSWSVDEGSEPGYVRARPSGRLINLSHAAAARSPGARRAARLGALLTAAFIMCTTGALVAFTLKEVQVRIVKLTHDLQYAMRAPGVQAAAPVGSNGRGRRRNGLDAGGTRAVYPGVPGGGGGGGEYMAVLLRYALDALVFVPIVAGVLFFLFEFFDDQALAFAVLVIAWLAEIAVSGSTRHWVSRAYLPRLFIVYFGAFHFYFFSFPLGFTWLAFATCVALMFHACLSVWNRFEMPLMQQQADARWEWR